MKTLKDKYKVEQSQHTGRYFIINAKRDKAIAIEPADLAECRRIVALANKSLTR